MRENYKDLDTEEALFKKPNKKKESEVKEFL